MATTKTVEKKKEVPFNIISFLFFSQHNNWATERNNQPTTRPPPTNLFFLNFQESATPVACGTTHFIFLFSKQFF
jgi:hypothetical protein